jgi:hypothetical protein
MLKAHEGEHMAQWNCRLVERNGDKVSMPWLWIEAIDTERAAEQYCHSAEVWDCTSWSEGDEGIVEVEAFGGEGGTHRMAVGAYTALEFSAEPAEED